MTPGRLKSFTHFFSSHYNSFIGLAPHVVMTSFILIYRFSTFKHARRLILSLYTINKMMFNPMALCTLLSMLWPFETDWFASATS